MPVLRPISPTRLPHPVLDEEELGLIATMANLDPWNACLYVKRNSRREVDGFGRNWEVEWEGKLWLRCKNKTHTQNLKRNALISRCV